MTHIQNAGYETVTAECDRCGALCIFNRLDDIGELERIDGRYVTCFECNKRFRIYNDTINPAYELFIFEAYKYFTSKRYMSCVVNLTQAWESFFSMFAASNFIYRPFFENSGFDRDPAWLNRQHAQLYKAIGNYTFAPLRNLLINTLVKQLHPATLQESEEAIRKIKTERLGENSKKSIVEEFPDAEVRDILDRLQRLRVGELRNKVIHQQAVPSTTDGS
ncbi:MAG: hypothetical protein ACR2GU_13020 [Rubrobacteraceae bacterium]